MLKPLSNLIGLGRDSYYTTMKHRKAASSKILQLARCFGFLVGFLSLGTLYIGVQHIHIAQQTLLVQQRRSCNMDDDAGVTTAGSASLLPSFTSGSTGAGDFGRRLNLASTAIPDRITATPDGTDKLPTDSIEDTNTNDPPLSKLGSLSCEKYGGPSDPDPAVREMIYWEDIPMDKMFVSPFLQKEKRQYLTFDADPGGFNNIRMNMETVITLAFAMGRTLVLPPEQPVYLFSAKDNHHQKSQKHQFGFNDFFRMDAIPAEHAGLNIITMEEYLIRERNNFRYLRNDSIHGTETATDPPLVAYPPGNRTNWDGASQEEMLELRKWLHSVSYIPSTWNPENCLAAFPASAAEADMNELENIGLVVSKENPHFSHFVGNPTPVNASALDRMRENWAWRKHLCTYDKTMQEAPLMHISADPEHRLLIHFYAFLFFQNYHHDLLMKRFVRDHLRYTDEIMCAAARVIYALRRRVRNRRSSDVFLVGGPKAEYDSMHGEFPLSLSLVLA
jgi:GDP-fucose protein O-fucosyltransferase